MENNIKKQINEGSEYAACSLTTIANGLPSYASFAEVTDHAELCDRVEKAGAAIMELVKWIRENSK